MKPHLSRSRRAFLSRTGQSIAALAVTGATLGAVEKSLPAIPVVGDQVRGIAAGPDGRLAVAVDQEIQLLGANGKMARRIPLDRAVRAVSFGPDGRLWMALKDRVGSIDHGTPKLLPTRLGRKTVITSLAVGPSGQIFVADSGSKMVLALSPDGSVQKRIGPSETGFTVSKAFFPIECRGNRLFVAEPGRHRIHVFDLDGEPVARWGARSRQSSGFAGCCNPVGIAVTGDGNVITAERGQTRIKAFGGKGDYQRELAGPEHFSKTPAVAVDDDLAGCVYGGIDVAITPEDRVLILDRARREIRKIS